MDSYIYTYIYIVDLSRVRVSITDADDDVQYTCNMLQWRVFDSRINVLFCSLLHNIVPTPKSDRPLLIVPWLMVNKRLVVQCHTITVNPKQTHHRLCSAEKNVRSRLRMICREQICFAEIRALYAWRREIIIIINNYLYYALTPIWGLVLSENDSHKTFLCVVVTGIIKYYKYFM